VSRSLWDSRGRARGQVLVIFAGGIVALIVGIAFVVDGGNALAQQRSTQNGIDAVSEAGTVVIAEYLMGGSSTTGVVGTCPTTPANPWDHEVCKAVYGAAANNNVTIGSVVYTDFKGDPIGAVGSGFPTGAQGVRAIGSRNFDTYFARIVGMGSFQATTQATAVTGTITTLCTPGQGCGLIPVTVPVQVDTCDNTGKLVPGVGPWPYLGEADTTPDNEAIVPLCKNQNDDIGGGSAGSVGWIDLSTAIGATTNGNCPNNFTDAVLNPCITGLPFETWVQTFAGGVGKGGPVIEDAFNSYHNDVVQIPLFDGTCKVQPGGVLKTDCPPGQIGVGVNTWYHIPAFASFKVDVFLMNGNDKKDCDKLPGAPFVGGNGANGCFKGWWVVALPGPGAIGLGPVTPSVTNQLGVQLIK
jgi:putative Flp pilus-assembly TadE/G-like protein